MTDNWTNEPYEEPDFDIFTKFCVFEEDTPMKYYVQQPDNFNRVCKTWDDLKEHVIDVVTELGEYKSTISVAAKVDLKYWHGDRVASYFDKQYDYVRLFLLDRYNFFNNNLKENNHSAFLIEK